MTREQLIELRWLLKTWTEEAFKTGRIDGMETDVCNLMVIAMDKQIREKEK